MSENAIHELADTELNEVTGGFFDPLSLAVGGAIGLGVCVLIDVGARNGVFDAIPYDQWFDK